MNYRDLGFDDSFADDSNKQPEFISGVQYELEGVAGGNILREGVSRPFGGNWQIKYDGDGIELPPGGLKNFQAQYDIRAFKAIVNPNGSGDFVNIQQAIDFVEENGGGVVYLTAGTYRPTRYIDIPSNVSLIGENRYTTIIDFQNATSVSDGCVQIRGTYVSSAGSITATNGNSGITGSSTTFVTDNVKPGDSILINNAPYEVDSVSSNTSLTITETYRGETGSSIPCRIIRAKENIEIANVNIKNGFSASPANGNGLEMTTAVSVYVHDCIFENNVDGVEASITFDLTLQNCLCRYNSSDGVRFGGSGRIVGNVIYNNIANGITVNAASLNSYADIVGNTVIGNGTSGVDFDISDGVTCSDNYISANLEYGVRLRGATFNKIDGNYIYKNGNDGVRVEAKVLVDSEDNLICNNFIRDNDGHAIELTTGTADNFIHGCIIRGNTTNSVSDSGSANTISDVS